jgi:hypothetical protein
MDGVWRGMEGGDEGGLGHGGFILGKSNGLGRGLVRREGIYCKVVWGLGLGLWDEMGWRNDVGMRMGGEWLCVGCGFGVVG